MCVFSTQMRELKHASNAAASPSACAPRTSYSSAGRFLRRTYCSSMLLTALYCHVLPLRDRPVTKTRTPSHVLFCDRRARQGTAFPVASALASACAARRVELTLYLVSTATTARARLLRRRDRRGRRAVPRLVAVRRRRGRCAVPRLFFWHSDRRGRRRSRGS